MKTLPSLPRQVAFPESAGSRWFSSFDRTVYSLLKPGIASLTFAPGVHRLRLLPQPIDAAEAWMLIVPYLAFGHPSYDPRSQQVPLTVPQARWVGRVAALLLRDFHGSPGGAPAPFACPPIRFAAVFQGFSLDTRHSRVLPIVLPSDGFLRSPHTRRPNPGTALAELLGQGRTATGQPHGWTPSLEETRPIELDVYGSAPHECVPRIGRPISWRRSHRRLVDHVQRYEDLVDYRSDAEIGYLLQLLLPVELSGYIDHAA